MAKLRSEAYEVDINLVCAGEDDIEVRASIQEIASTLSVYDNFGQNSLRIEKMSREASDIEAVKERKIQQKNILSTAELA